MLLVIDVGNTLTKFGLFDSRVLVQTFQRKTDATETYDVYKAKVVLFLESHHFSSRDIEGAIISSVVPSLKTILMQLVEDLTGRKALTVGPRLKTGMPLLVDNPQEVGSDLVCDSVGGVIRHGKGLFIADLGTANKYIFIDKNGAYAGLVIAPGLGISMEALVGKTATLPEVSMGVPPHVIGKNTPDCMNSGITYGTVYEIEGFAAAFEKEAGYPLKRILTGGNASYVKDLLVPHFDVDDNMLLYGLEEIYERNRR